MGREKTNNPSKFKGIHYGVPAFAVLCRLNTTYLSCYPIWYNYLMKWKQTIIHEDPTLLENLNLSELSRRSGISYSFLMKLKSGEKIAIEETYKKLRKISDAIRNLDK